jgi:hypothetical protein
LFQYFFSISGNAGYEESAEFGRVLHIRDITGCVTTPVSRAFERKKFTLVVYAKLTRASFSYEWVYLFSHRSKTRNVQIVVHSGTKQMEFVYGGKLVNLFKSGDIFERKGWQIFAVSFDVKKLQATMFLNDLGKKLDADRYMQEWTDPTIEQINFGSYEPHDLNCYGLIAMVSVYPYLMTGRELMRDFQQTSK